MKTQQDLNSNLNFKTENSSKNDQKALKDHASKSNQPFWKSIWFKTIIYVVLLLLVVVSLIRIPYVGVAIDGLISFVIGFAKYLVYLYLIVILCLLILNKKIKILFSKRFIFAIFCSTIFLAILLSGIQQLNILSQNKSNNLNEYINYWKAYIFNFDKYFIFGKANFIDGGIIGTLISYISGLFLIIFAAIAIITIFLLLFKSWRNSVVNRVKNIRDKTTNALKSKMKNKEDNEIVQEKIDFVQATKNEHNELKLTQTLTENYLDSLLLIKKPQYHHINFEIANDLDEKNIFKKFQNFLFDNNIQYSDIKTKNEQTKFLVIVKMDDNYYHKFHLISNSLNMIFNDIEYIIDYLDNIIVVQFYKNKSLINKQIQKIINLKIINPLDYTFAFNEKYSPITLNLKTNSFIGINSFTRINVIDLLNTILTSISWNYAIKNIDVYFLTPTKNDFPILENKVVKKVIENANDITEFLLNIESYCNNLLKQFKTFNLKNVYDLNQKRNVINPNKIIIIDEINLLIQNHPNILQIIKRLTTIASICGITLICIDNSSVFESYNTIEYQNIILFKTSKEVSMRVLNNHNAYKLNKNNYGIILNEKEQKQMPFTTCNFNNNEVKMINECILKTYNKLKI